MKVAKPNGSSDVDVRGNIQELTLGDGLHRQVENSNGEMSAGGLGTLLRRVSEASRREIGNLVGELQMLDKKLQTNGDRIQHYIEEARQKSLGCYRQVVHVFAGIRAGNNQHSPRY